MVRVHSTVKLFGQKDIDNKETCRDKKKKKMKINIDSSINEYVKKGK